MSPRESCDSCNAPIPVPKHGTGIGGGWLFLCDSCAARVCACGAVVLPKGRNGAACGRFTEEEGVSGQPTVHGFHRCETFRAPEDGGATFPPLSYTERPDGCPCDGCEANRAFDRIEARP